LETFANIESFDHGNRDTPLAAACRVGQSDTVKVLLEKQASIEAIGIDRETPLIPTSKYGYSPPVTLLLQHGAST